MARRLGRQTVTVWERVAGQHGEFSDGPAQVWPDCVLLPAGSGDAGGGRDGDGRRGGEARRWTLYAPPGRRASRDAQCSAVPGPTGPDGQPLRLSLVTTAEPIWDRRGVEAYVSVEVRLLSAG